MGDPAARPVFTRHRLTDSDPIFEDAFKDMVQPRSHAP